MTDTGAAGVMEGPWRGPFDVPWQKLMMWIFIVTDALLFAGLLVGYGVMRSATEVWPDQNIAFDMNYITLMTFTLITSSATMACAVAAATVGNKKHVTMFLWLTILGGAAFLGMQVYEWTHFIHEGARLTSNPWGVPQFSACFFIINRLPWDARHDGRHRAADRRDPLRHGEVFRPGRRERGSVLAFRRPRLGLRLRALLSRVTAERGNSPCRNRNIRQVTVTRATG